MRIQRGDSIPFSYFISDSNGNGIADASIFVDVINVDNDTILLSAQPLTANTAFVGFYTFIWTHGITTPTNLAYRAYEMVNNKKVILEVDNIKITSELFDLIENIDSADGRAI